ncbi:hypothetical protein JOF48_000559 [Arthrobacter stackebrandtii]|uniref:Helicase C-terminal domain-containing protein n=1 Tax=Arthrobacter stackebrandtii TaxID=272161 RepID=A0ABS4YSK1_9MICC|nr:helicase-related protein [Arthrobacter stackebrandtii]MBP2411760.1 hypothetical protein [Arthrobacter stackebrandtii]PYG99152.1 helicase [Arthrobacter stackebrandtii]
MSLTAAQSSALKHIRKAYLGPEQGVDEVLFNRPSLQYIVGMLFPFDDSSSSSSATDTPELNPDDFVSADVEEGDVEEEYASTPLAEDWRPSSVAISFVTDGDSIACDFAAATYVMALDDGPRRWTRHTHSYSEVRLTKSMPHRPINVGGIPIEIGTRWRRYGDNWLVTLHVRVLAKSTGDDLEDIERILFQVDISARPAAGSQILEYDVAQSIDLDSESRELLLRYRRRKVFGVGHGMAAGWDIDDSGKCSRVFLDPVPHYVVPAIAQTGLDPASIAAMSLDIAHLETIDRDPAAVIHSLHAFVDQFASWVVEQELEGKDLGSDAVNVAARSRIAAKRMKTGIDYLASEENTQLRLAFSLGMSAMRLQMEKLRPLDKAVWRPFQLGFILVSLASTTDATHPDRELVDLIWFPTGGGKTEAYLALASIAIFLRRIKHGIKGAGTAVITRYTLRLLTSQQFQRAASVICAMELLRELDPRVQGMAKFSIGLWVGNEVTPGTRADAIYSLDRLYKARNPREANKFQISQCPWCRTELVPELRDDTKRAYGAQQAGKDVIFRCVNRACEFSSRELPMAVVDEVLYDDPPTFLLATVDKFARLQFKERAGRLLGIGTAYKQPSLIIQDELHLLSGPLGTTVAVFDAVIQLLLNRSGTHPKIIASTATIRASNEQVQGLYGRKVALYPPAGLDGDTTFFAQPIASGKGRLYLGVMPQSIPQATALVSAAAPLLEIPAVVQDTEKLGSKVDPYWTVVMYHNSLRELGRTGSLLLDDVNARLETRSDRLGVDLRRIQAESVLELTSRRSPEELPNDLRQLETSADVSSDAVDVVLSSNMLSVGIDVQRLAMMLMVGQPKTTAEYIQATSRVGRGSINGIVVTLFRSNRARDRSHFETFRSYHDVLYQNVEPTSVTPWSLSSRDRSLAGALIMLMRQSIPALASDDSATNFDLENLSLRSILDPLIDKLLASISRADPSERDEASEQLWALLRDWDRVARTAREDGQPLLYERRAGSGTGLLKRFGEPGSGWLVGDSMRSVEPNVAVEVQEPFQEVERAQDQT